MPRRKPVAQSPVSPEIKLETLQAISFELIANSMKLWRSYSEDKDGKGQRINKAAQIHEMVIAAVRFHPDIQHLRELDKYREEAERIIANARKVFETTSGSERA